jgi:hypothetical protein
MPRPTLARLLDDIRRGLGEARADVVYGTIRLIERDDESFLAWARDRWACVIFNLHVVHTPAGLERASRAFRLLIDLAIAYGGSYFSPITAGRPASRSRRAIRSLRSFCGASERTIPRSAFRASGIGTTGRCSGEAPGRCREPVVREGRKSPSSAPRAPAALAGRAAAPGPVTSPATGRRAPVDPERVDLTVIRRGRCSNEVRRSTEHRESVDVGPA